MDGEKGIKTPRGRAGIESPAESRGFGAKSAAFGAPGGFLLPPAVPSPAQLHLPWPFVVPGWSWESSGKASPRSGPAAIPENPSWVSGFSPPEIPSALPLSPRTPGIPDPKDSTLEPNPSPRDGRRLFQRGKREGTTPTLPIPNFPKSLLSRPFPFPSLSCPVLGSPPLASPQTPRAARGGLGMIPKGRSQIQPGIPRSVFPARIPRFSWDN